MAGFIIGCIVGLIIVVVWLAIASEKKRKEQLEAIARELGFSFTPKADSTVFEDLGGFSLFSAGHSKRAKNLMDRESQGIKVSLFEYRYTTGGGQSSSTHNQTVICFRSEILNLPTFKLRPENILDKLGSLVGMKDFDFKDSSEFSKRYLLAGKHEESVRELFHLDLRRFFEQHWGLSVEGESGRLIIYRSNKRIKPLDLRVELELAFDIFNMIKAE